MYETYSTGKSAMMNEFYYPKKENGDKIKGFHNTYKRMDWEQPWHMQEQQIVEI